MHNSRYQKLINKQARCGPVLSTNLTILWLCLCFFMQIISLATNEWYIRKSDVIEYWHGGLWNMCLGEIKRTFCSYNRDIPDWLRATQSLLLISLAFEFINIVYIMVGIARKKLRISVMLGLTNITWLFFLTGVAVYTACGYSDKIKPSRSFIAAWATVGALILGAIFTLISFMKVSKISKKKSLETGIQL